MREALKQTLRCNVHRLEKCSQDALLLDSDLDRLHSFRTHTKRLQYVEQRFVPLRKLQPTLLLKLRSHRRGPVSDLRGLSKGNYHHASQTRSEIFVSLRHRTFSDWMRCNLAVLVRQREYLEGLLLPIALGSFSSLPGSWDPFDAYTDAVTDAESLCRP